MLLVPFETIEDNFVGGFLPGKHGGEQNAVVVDVRLVAKNSDFKFRRMLQNLFDTGNARHAIPYYD